MTSAAGNRHDLLDHEMRPLQLTFDEKAQLKAFLHSLSGS